MGVQCPGRHSRLRQYSIILVEGDLAATAKHDLEATIRLADIVQPACQGDVLDERLGKSGRRCERARERLDVLAVLVKCHQTSCVKGLVPLGGQLDARLE